MVVAKMGIKQHELFTKESHTFTENSGLCYCNCIIYIILFNRALPGEHSVNDGQGIYRFVSSEFPQ